MLAWIARVYVFIYCFKLNIYPGQQVFMLIKNAIKDLNLRLGALFWEVLIDIVLIMYPHLKEKMQKTFLSEIITNYEAQDINFWKTHY